MFTAVKNQRKADFLRGYSVLKISAVFLICGFMSGTVYDLARFLGLLFSAKAAVFFFDFLFFAVYSLLFFVLLLGFNNGIMRAMYAAVYFGGLIVYLLLISRKTIAVRKQAVLGVKSFVEKQKQSFKKVLQFMHKLYYNKIVLHNKLKSGDENGKVFSQPKRK